MVSGRIGVSLLLLQYFFIFARVGPEVREDHEKMNAKIKQRSDEIEAQAPRGTFFLALIIEHDRISFCFPSFQSLEYTNRQISGAPGSCSRESKLWQNEVMQERELLEEEREAMERERAAVEVSDALHTVGCFSVGTH